MGRDIQLDQLQTNMNFPYGVLIAKGDFQKIEGVEKFGYNGSVGTSFETVWSGGGDYAGFITSAGVATVTSSDTVSDNGGTVLVSGLDSNYDQVSETLTIGGSAGSVNFIRIFRLEMKTANTGDVNVGTLTATVGATTMAQIDPTYGQTLMAVYTIPRNYRAYLINLDIGNSKDQELEIVYRTKQISNGNVWATKAFLTLRGGFAVKDFLLPTQLPEKTDIEIRAKSSSNASVSAGFELVLEKILI